MQIAVTTLTESWPDDGLACAEFVAAFRFAHEPTAAANRRVVYRRSDIHKGGHFL